MVTLPLNGLLPETKIQEGLILMIIAHLVEKSLMIIDMPTVEVNEILLEP